MHLSHTALRSQDQPLRHELWLAETLECGSKVLLLQHQGGTQSKMKSEPCVDSLV